MILDKKISRSRRKRLWRDRRNALNKLRRARINGVAMLRLEADVEEITRDLERGMETVYFYKKQQNGSTES